MLNPPSDFALLWADVWWLVVLVSFLAGPFVGWYIIHRVLTDLRRIATALEHRAYEPSRVTPAVAPGHSEPVIARTPGIATSAFGR